MQEILSGAGLMLVPEEEYSEAGRGVYPDGLFQVLVQFHDRYKAKQPKLRYIITENGFADARDVIRRPYLVEHLLAINAAIQQVCNLFPISHSDANQHTFSKLSTAYLIPSGYPLSVCQSGNRNSSRIEACDVLLTEGGIVWQGVPVDGYLQWTISDNWEWADGYCPKFGLVDVDRANNLTRVPRPSYYLYQQVTPNPKFQINDSVVLLSHVPQPQSD